ARRNRACLSCPPTPGRGRGQDGRQGARVGRNPHGRLRHRPRVCGRRPLAAGRDGVRPARRRARSPDARSALARPGQAGRGAVHTGEGGSTGALGGRDHQGPPGHRGAHGRAVVVPAQGRPGDQAPPRALRRGRLPRRARRGRDTVGGAHSGGRRRLRRDGPRQALCQRAAADGSGRGAVGRGGQPVRRQGGGGLGAGD
ncbi:MAG: hypothetical protein AVDCRST_MAG01-01-3554, partial [uncultured Rubrobacteraceae bacterium]